MNLSEIPPVPARLGALVALALVTALSLTGALADDIKIAVVGDMSSAGSGAPTAVLAVRAALDDARKTGALTDNVQLVIRDDKCDPGNARVVAAELLEREKVKLVVGHSCPGASLAAARYYRSQGLLTYIETANSALILTEEAERGKTNLVFRVAERQDLAAQIAANALRTQLAGKKICLIGDPRATWTERFQKLTAGNASRVTVVDSLPNAEPNTDLCVVYDPHNRSGVTQLVGRSDVVSVSGPELVSASIQGNAKQLEALDKQIRETGYKSSLAPAINAYAAVQIWIKARREARNDDLTKISEKMHELNFDTIRGPVSFDKVGDVRQPLITLLLRANPVIQVPNGCNEPQCANCKCTGCCSN